MKPLPESLTEYRTQLAAGHIQVAYRGIMDYIASLKNYFKTRYPEYSVPGTIYYGYMDMTYFPLFPEALKTRKLKIAVVFVHETFRFEVWLSGINKQIQAEYQEVFRDIHQNKYQVTARTQGSDSILELIVAEDPDFSNQNSLTQQIEKETIRFIKDIEEMLSGILK